VDARGGGLLGTLTKGEGLHLFGAGEGNSRGGESSKKGWGSFHYADSGTRMGEKSKREKGILRKEKIIAGNHSSHNRRNFL